MLHATVLVSDSWRNDVLRADDWCSPRLLRRRWDARGVVHERGVAIELDGEHGDLTPFSVLDRAADSARVAFVGEMDHFIEEKYAYRLLCIRYLVSRGWRWFGEEIPASQGRRAAEGSRCSGGSALASRRRRLHLDHH